MMKKLEIKVKGMMCAGCENRVQNALKTIDGVEKVVANHEAGIVAVSLEDVIEEETIKEKIEDIGYEVE